jgi:hypothetical protein
MHTVSVIVMTLIAAGIVLLLVVAGIHFMHDRGRGKEQRRQADADWALQEAYEAFKRRHEDQEGGEG